jgi:hypothetical protein
VIFRIVLDSMIVLLLTNLDFFFIYKHGGYPQRYGTNGQCMKFKLNACCALRNKISCAICAKNKQICAMRKLKSQIICGNQKLTCAPQIPQIDFIHCSPSI